ncbi:hypothetical protein H6G96_37630 [Nostoc sp. FACHB-892]|uniref:hypothetical protein n=1 Tax=Nostoc sp. FACHB-892 TaxID=2692843 RepID=UPI0016848951|nr:hypothetical protein [Nostoc sp. FACHB-892]MBD2731845.1 hypothetical protein [Nostoc sp. FACHB-892]
MANQTILFTVMPRGISVDPETLPVSVYVSPRLFGDSDQAQLREFPDWLNWTSLLQTRGMSLTFRCEGVDFTAAVATDHLQPSLWNALFKPETLVRSHTFDNYSEHQIFSYSNRNTLSLLKGLYQQAGIELALPESRDRRDREEQSNYEKLQDLVTGLAVNWNDNLRDRYRDGGRESLRNLQEAIRKMPLGTDGLYQTAMNWAQLANVRSAVAQEFEVYHRLPPGQPIADNPPDFDNLLDFHLCLSSLNSYPELLRALGLVLDFELPLEAVPVSDGGRMSVIAATPSWEWSITTRITPLETAYVHVVFGTSPRYFRTQDNYNQAEAFGAFGAFGVLNFDPQQFGLAQVDVDGGMHKTIMLAETVQKQQDEDGNNIIDPIEAPHPQVFDPYATLPSLRSGGFSLFADEQGEKLLRSFKDSKAFQDATDLQQPQPHPFFAQDLTHGYRLDVWDSHTNAWHSLHRRNGVYSIEDQQLTTTNEEGFVELAVAQPAPDPTQAPQKDIYVHETFARWAGWSLSVQFPGKVLSSDPDPANVLDQPSSEQNQPVTPFKMTTDFKVVSGSLPSLRFGRCYRFRARVVDICGNSLSLDHPLLESLLKQMILPQDNPCTPDVESFAYLRYEPVIPPQVVLRDERGVTAPGSQLDRLVIRTFNSDPSLDNSAADLTASDRHILPPRTSVELAERMGMLDDATGKLNSSPALYNLLAAKDGVELNQIKVWVAGQEQQFPLEASERIDSLPYIPDVLARGAALRDLPGTPNQSLGMVLPGTEANTVISYHQLDDPNPRPGSATLVSFGDEGDWQTLQPFRLALGDGNASPAWDAQNRVLTVSLPKGTSAVVPLTSYLSPQDLSLMGVWQWLREYIDYKTVVDPDRAQFSPWLEVDRIAHILQRSVEGGHWMLTPPQLLNLVHAVQQPLGIPTFTAIPIQHEPYNELRPDDNLLQAPPEVGVIRTAIYRLASNSTELNPITAWRRPGSTDAYLLGGLQIHGASTARVDILAEWDYPVDDVNQAAPGSIHRAMPVERIPILQLQTGEIRVTPDNRAVSYYDAAQDLLCFVRQGDRLGNLGDLTDYTISILIAKEVIPLDKQKGLITFTDKDGDRISQDAAPRHQINDTKHHRIRYCAVSTSRYREYFPQEQDDPLNPGTKIAVDFTRKSQPVTVDVPASSRPVAPQIAYVIPTFGWQRQTQTNLKRSVRFGGGLRVYLERPWFSSGEGELLGVVLYNYTNGVDLANTQERDRWKSFITQWGNDPIWRTQGLFQGQVPSTEDFVDAVAQETFLSLEEDATKRVNVVGYAVAFDAERQKWYCDLSVNAASTYALFVRLALVRYQPCALENAKLSRVVLADFAQLSSDRAVVVTADPYHPRQLQVTISGAKPEGPLPQIVPTPTQSVETSTQIEVELQQRDDLIDSDLAWNTIAIVPSAVPPSADPTILWSGKVLLAENPTPDCFRLLIREYEYISAEYTTNPDGTTNPAIPSDFTTETRIIGSAPRRLIYAETIAIDAALISQAPPETRRTKLDESL